MDRTALRLRYRERGQNGFRSRVAELRQVVLGQANPPAGSGEQDVGRWLPVRNGHSRRLNFWGTENRNELDSASALLAIDNYCKANPLKHVADAAEAVFKERLNDLPAAEGGFGHTKK